MPRPKPGEAPEYFFRYINLTEADTIGQLLEKHAQVLADFYNALPSDKSDFAYAEGKWNLKQVLQHVIDTERVFVYRMLCFARRQEAALPSMDENTFAKYATVSQRSLQEIQEEFSLLRSSTDKFLLSLTDEAYLQKGIASDNLITVNAIAYIIYGHLLHHKNILTERYLN